MAATKNAAGHPALKSLKTWNAFLKPADGEKFQVPSGGYAGAFCKFSPTRRAFTVKDPDSFTLKELSDIGKLFPAIPARRQLPSSPLEIWQRCDASWQRERTEIQLLLDTITNVECGKVCEIPSLFTPETVQAYKNTTLTPFFSHASRKGFFHTHVVCCNGSFLFSPVTLALHEHLWTLLTTANNSFIFAQQVEIFKLQISLSDLQPSTSLPMGRLDTNVVAARDVVNSLLPGSFVDGTGLLSSLIACIKESLPADMQTSIPHWETMIEPDWDRFAAAVQQQQQPNQQEAADSDLGPQEPQQPQRVFFLTWINASHFVCGVTEGKSLLVNDSLNVDRRPQQVSDTLQNKLAGNLATAKAARQSDSRRTLQSLLTLSKSPTFAKLLSHNAKFFAPRQLVTSNDCFYACLCVFLQCCFPDDREQIRDLWDQGYGGWLFRLWVAEILATGVFSFPSDDFVERYRREIDSTTAQGWKLYKHKTQPVASVTVVAVECTGHEQDLQRVDALLCHTRAINKAVGGPDLDGDGGELPADGFDEQLQEIQPGLVEEEPLVLEMQLTQNEEVSDEVLRDFDVVDPCSTCLSTDAAGSDAADAAERADGGQAGQGTDAAGSDAADAAERADGHGTVGQVGHGTEVPSPHAVLCAACNKSHTSAPAFSTLDADMLDELAPLKFSRQFALRPDDDFEAVAKTFMTSLQAGMQDQYGVSAYGKFKDSTTKVRARVYCSHGHNKSKKKGSARVTQEMLTLVDECPRRVSYKWSNEDQRFELVSEIVEHNHCPLQRPADEAQRLSDLPDDLRLGLEALAFLPLGTMREHANLRLKELGGELKHVSTSLLKSIQTRVRQSSVGGSSACQLVTSLLGLGEFDPSFTLRYAIDKDSTRIKGVFLQTGVMAELAAQYRDVHYVDTVYNTNTNNLPVTLGSVVDRHHKVRLIWISVTGEAADDHAWTFEQQLQANKTSPVILFCDFADAFLTAGKRVYPNTIILNCHVHLERFLSKPDKAKLYHGHTQSEFLQDFQHALNQISERQFRVKMEKVLEKYPAFRGYYDSELRPKERHFARFFRAPLFLAGSDSTNLHEGLNSGVKKFVGKKSLARFFLGVVEYSLHRHRASIQLDEKTPDYTRFQSDVFKPFLRAIQQDFTAFVAQKVSENMRQSANFKAHAQTERVMDKFRSTFAEAFHMRLPDGATNVKFFRILLNSAGPETSATVVPPTTSATGPPRRNAHYLLTYESAHGFPEFVCTCFAAQSSGTMCPHIFSAFLADSSVCVHVGMLNWRFLKRAVRDSNVEVICFTQQGKADAALKAYRSTALVPDKRRELDPSLDQHDHDHGYDLFAMDSALPATAGVETETALAKVKCTARQTIDTAMAKLWALRDMIDRPLTLQSDAELITSTAVRITDIADEGLCALKGTQTLHKTLSLVGDDVATLGLPAPPARKGKTAVRSNIGMWTGPGKKKAATGVDAITASRNISTTIAQASKGIEAVKTNLPKTSTRKPKPTKRKNTDEDVGNA
jgi:hypothetical protein